MVFKRKVIPSDPLSQEAINKKEKVYLKYSPYFLNDIQVEITIVEQIPFYHKKINGSRVLGEFLKDKNVKKRIRKRVLKDVLKFWEKDFKENMSIQNKAMLEKTTKIKHKKIKKISLIPIYLFGLICITSILLSQKIKYLSNAPFIKGFINKFNIIIQNGLYNNLLLGLIYVSLVACLYLIILKTYFDIMRKVGYNAETFINNEFKKLNKHFNVTHKGLKAHLFKFMRSKFYKKTYKIKKLYDPKVVIDKLEKYSQYIENKYFVFRKKYILLLFISFFLKISVIGLTGYIGYIYYITK